MKCKRCKKGELIFVINFGEDYEKEGLTETISCFKREGQVWVCDKCGRCSLIKIKEDEEIK